MSHSQESPIFRGAGGVALRPARTPKYRVSRLKCDIGKNDTIGINSTRSEPKNKMMAAAPPLHYSGQSALVNFSSARSETQRKLS